jgi:hypothetical protein
VGAADDADTGRQRVKGRGAPVLAASPHRPGPDERPGVVGRCRGQQPFSHQLHGHHAIGPGRRACDHHVVHRRRWRHGRGRRRTGRRGRQPWAVAKQQHPHQVGGACPEPSLPGRPLACAVGPLTPSAAAGEQRNSGVEGPRHRLASSMTQPLNPHPRSITVTALASPALSSQCDPAQFLAALRPTIVFGAAGPGFALGGVNMSDDSSGSVSWVQAAGAFMRQPPSQPAVLAAVAGRTTLPGSTTLRVTP